MYNVPHFWTNRMIAWCFSLSLTRKAKQVVLSLRTTIPTNDIHVLQRDSTGKIFETLWQIFGTLARSIVKFWEILVGTTWSLPGHRLPIQGRLVLIISIAETCLNHVHPQVLSIAVFWSSTGPGLSEIVGQYQINVWKCWTISSSFNSALSCKLLWGWTMFFLSKVYARLDHYQCRGGLG